MYRPRPFSFAAPASRLCRSRAPALLSGVASLLPGVGDAPFSARRRPPALVSGASRCLSGVALPLFFSGMAHAFLRYGRLVLLCGVACGRRLTTFECLISSARCPAVSQRPSTRRWRPCRRRHTLFSRDHPSALAITGFRMHGEHFCGLSWRGTVLARRQPPAVIARSAFCDEAISQRRQSAARVPARSASQSPRLVTRLRRCARNDRLSDAGYARLAQHQGFERMQRASPVP
jgi:hypothetical protein